MKKPTHIIQHQLGFTHVILVREKDGEAVRRWDATAGVAMSAL